VFYLVAGLYVIPIVGVAFLAKQPSREATKKIDKRIDWLGALLLTGGFVLLFLSLSQSIHERRGWRTPCESMQAPAMRSELIVYI
jgi:hypothetical protein